MPIAEQQLASWLAFLDYVVLDQEKDQAAFSSTFTNTSQPWRSLHVLFFHIFSSSVAVITYEI
jgi:hypothetical protein